MPDSKYPLVNLAALDPATVRLVWLLLVVAAYASLLLLAHARRTSVGWAEHGLALCGLALLQPFTQRYALCVLVWPTLVAGALMARGRCTGLVRGVIYLAASLALLQAFAPGAARQRLLEVLGLDFVVTCLVAAVMAWASLGWALESGQNERECSA